MKSDNPNPNPNPKGIESIKKLNPTIRVLLLCNQYQSVIFL